MRLKPIIWMRGSLAGLRRFPKPAQHRIGFALKFAQAGEKHADAKPLKGFGGAGVLEIVEDFAGDAYRAVYTVKLKKRSTCSMPSRRNPNPESQLRSGKWI